MTISNLVFPSNDAILAIINKDHPDYNDVVITGFTEFKSKEDYCNFIGVERTNNNQDLIHAFFKPGRSYRDKIHNHDDEYLICTSIDDDFVNFIVMDGYDRRHDFTCRIGNIVIDDWEYGNYTGKGWESYTISIDLNNDNRLDISSEQSKVSIYNFFKVGESYFKKNYNFQFFCKNIDKCHISFTIVNDGLSWKTLSYDIDKINPDDWQHINTEKTNMIDDISQEVCNLTIRAKDDGTFIKEADGTFIKSISYLHTSLDRILKLEGTITRGFFRKEYGVYRIYDLSKGVWSEPIEDSIKDLKRLHKEYIPILTSVAAILITTNFEDADNVRHIHKIK